MSVYVLDSYCDCYIPLLLLNICMYAYICSYILFRRVFLSLSLSTQREKSNMASRKNNKFLFHRHYYFFLLLLCVCVCARVCFFVNERMKRDEKEREERRAQLSYIHTHIYDAF